MDLYLEREFPSISRGDLRAIFYRFHKTKREELYPRNSKIRAFNPITLKRVSGSFELDQDRWYAVYYDVSHRGHYFVTIREGKNMFGPHVAELQIQIAKGVTAWLGTMQLKFMFSDRKKLRKLLRIAIMRKKYWMSESSEEELVSFDPTPPSQDKDLSI